MAVKPCIEKIDLPKEMKDYIIRQREEHAKNGLNQKEADLLSAKTLQEKALDELHNVYHQLGVGGYGERITETAKKPITESTKNKNGLQFDKDNKDKFYITKDGKYRVFPQDLEMVVRDKETNDKVSKAVEKRALREYAENFDFTHGKEATEVPEDVKDNTESLKHIIKTSENPYQVAEIYVNEEPQTQSLTDKEVMIADYGVQIHEDSFSRFSDKNLLTPEIKKAYIVKDKDINTPAKRSQLGIDTQAKEISDHYGVEVTPQDIVDFIERFPGGVKDALKLTDSEVSIAAQERFKELTGLKLNHELAEKVINQKFDLLTKKEQELAQKDYETEQQLTDDYWKAFKETDGFTKESTVSEVKQTEATQKVDNGKTATAANDKSVSANAAESKKQGSETPISESTNTTGQSDAASGTTIPPVEPPVKEGAPSPEDEEWTAVRKEKLKEIEGVKKLFEKRQPKTWSDIYDSALQRVQEMYPTKSLYEAMRSRVGDFVTQLEQKHLFNPTSEDIAVFNVLRNETQRRINDIDGLDSHVDIVRQAALGQFYPLHSDLINIARVTNPEGEAGRAFGMHQSELKFDPEYGLKIRRMELLKAKHGEKLSPEDEAWVKDQWSKEDVLNKKIESVQNDAMRQGFEDKIAELQREYEEKLKAVGSTSKNTPANRGSKEKTLSQKGKSVADAIRKLKKPKGGLSVDFSFGTWDIAVEGVAKLVEAGSTVAEAINKLVKDAVVAFKTPTDKDSFENHLTDWLRNHKDKQESLDAIEKFAKDNNVTTATKDMVGKNLIRDFINSHIGETDKKEILNEAYKDLKKVLPDISKSELMEAYLKEGDFKQPTKKQLENGIAQQANDIKRIAKSELTADQEQKLKLARDKEAAIKSKKDFERKLKDGEFEEKAPVKLKKQDAELIQLRREQANIEEQYRKKQKELQEKNKSGWERAADFARSTYVALLIGHPATLAKVGVMSVLRPFSEVASKRTFGKIFDAIFPNISKAALRGGESSSMRSIQAGAEAYFKQMGEKGMREVYEKAERQYNEAAKIYTDYEKSDTPSKEKLAELKNNMNNKLIKVQGTFLYNFIGGSSLKDALTALVNRSNVIERQFGHVEGESIKDGNKLDSANYILGFIGRSHSAAKTFSGRFSFAAGFMARLEGAVKAGEDISSGSKVLEIAHESYLDWERGKYQQSNKISDLWNKMVNSIAKGEKGSEREGTAKAIETVLKTDVAITRVPVNILHEAIVEYTFGIFKATYMAAKSNLEIRNQLKSEGFTNGGKELEGVVSGNSSKEFKQALRDRISQMDETQAATIARCFRKGGIGLGLYALALITSGIHFGIFPHLGQKKKKDEDKLKAGELNPGQVMLGDNKFGETASGIIEHIPAFWTTFMGVGLVQAYDDQIKKHKTTNEAAATSIMTHLKIIEGSIPQSKVISPSKVITSIGYSIKKRLTEVGLLDEKKKHRK